MVMKSGLGVILIITAAEWVANTSKAVLQKAGQDYDCFFFECFCLVDFL